VGRVLKSATLERKLSLNSFMDGGILNSAVDLVLTDGADKEETDKVQEKAKDKFVNTMMRHKKSGSTLRVYSRLDHEGHS